MYLKTLAIQKVCFLLLWIVLPLATASCVGCAGYRMGTRTLHRPDIRTVYIPIIRSDSFRSDLGVRLTEVLQKRIEDRTPYKIANAGAADSTLVCRITNDSKRVITENALDDVRALQVSLIAEVNWVDRIGNVLMENRFLPPNETAFYFSEQTLMVPEGGQSISTSQQRAIERMADHIVDQLEARW